MLYITHFCSNQASARQSTKKNQKQTDYLIIGPILNKHAANRTFSY